MVDNENAEHFLAVPICTAAEAADLVPKGPGYYAIFVDSPRALGSHYQKVLAQTRTLAVTQKRPLVISSKPATLGAETYALTEAISLCWHG